MGGSGTENAAEPPKNEEVQKISVEVPPHAEGKAEDQAPAERSPHTPLTRQKTEKTPEFLKSLEHQRSKHNWMSIEFFTFVSTKPDVTEKEFPEYGIYVGQLDQKKGLHGTGAFRYENGDVYQGEWENNRRHGSGVCVFKDKTKYEGEWCEDNIQGEGCLTYNDGSHYKGTFQDNVKHGHGQQHYASGAEYTGDWVRGKKHGTGTMVSFDGNTYTGSWKDDKRDGQGSYQRKNGEWQYTGSWEQGKRQGPGHIKYSNGDVYSGDFKLDMFHGEGKMHYADGSHYTGEWENNHKHGEGTLVSANREKYSGYWAQGMREGFGVQVYLQMDRYEGQWVQDEFNGEGTFTYFQRHQRYEGDFRDGYRHGKGRMIYALHGQDWYEGDWVFDIIEGHGTRLYEDGSTYVGDWKDGKREGTGVLERKVWGKNGDTVWKYEGAFSADMQHGDGVETFKTTKVWVTYQRDRLVECFLKEAETRLKQRKAWSKDGQDDCIARGEVRLQLAAWRRLELAFTDSVSELHNLAVGSPMVRVLLKNRDPKVSQYHGVHLDDADADEGSPTPPSRAPLAGQGPRQGVNGSPMTHGGGPRAGGGEQSLALGGPGPSPAASPWRRHGQGTPGAGSRAGSASGWHPRQQVPRRSSYDLDRAGSGFTVNLNGPGSMSGTPRGVPVGLGSPRASAHVTGLGGHVPGQEHTVFGHHHLHLRPLADAVRFEVGLSRSAHLPVRPGSSAGAAGPGLSRGSRTPRGMLLSSSPRHSTSASPQRSLLGSVAALFDGHAPAAAQSPLSVASPRTMENAALKLQRTLSPSSSRHTNEVGLLPLLRKPGGSIAMRRKAKEERSSEAVLPSHSLANIAADWGPPGPKIDLGRSEPPL